MAKHNVSLDLGLKRIDERRNDSLQEINTNGLMSKKHVWNVSGTLNSFVNSFIIISGVSGCVLNSVFASLARIPAERIGSLSDWKFVL